MIYYMFILEVEMHIVENYNAGLINHIATLVNADGTRC